MAVAYIFSHLTAWRRVWFAVFSRAVQQPLIIKFTYELESKKYELIYILHVLIPGARRVVEPDMVVFFLFVNWNRTSNQMRIYFDWTGSRRDELSIIPRRRDRNYIDISQRDSRYYLYHNIMYAV